MRGCVGAILMMRPTAQSKSLSGSPALMPVDFDTDSASDLDEYGHIENCWSGGVMPGREKPSAVRDRRYKRFARIL